MMDIGVSARAGDLPKGYWSEKKSQEILDKTLTITLAPNLDHLDARERDTLDILLEVGDILQRLYENTRHHQARSGYQDLVELDKRMGHPSATQNLLSLYRLFKGPIGRSLNNKTITILPVDKKRPGRSVFPWGVKKSEIEKFLEAHPETEPDVLHVRSVVRRTDPVSLRNDIRTLNQLPVLSALHPNLKPSLAALLDAPNDRAFYTVPYSVAYAEDLMVVYELLHRAADTIEKTDAEFARYLRHRAVDLLRDDYEAGDAAWVTGRFGNLNAQIGSYETYDDELYSVKSFFGVSVLVEDPVMTSSLNTVVKWLQQFEDKLPYEAKKRVRDDIPVGVYNVVADFGQARGTNTATILPNESYITRKYGRTILLRRNIMEHPELFEIRKAAFAAAVDDEQHKFYKPKGDFFRTMFHEIGHYLGPDRDKNGRSLDIALQENSSILEELKSDLVSLFVSKNLSKRGYYPQVRLRAVQCSGVRRVLRKNRPARSQVYGTMQLMQMNYFLENGLLVYDAKKNKLHIEFGNYHTVVEAMLREVLQLQYEGDKNAVDRFIEKYTEWDKKLHEPLAKAMRSAETYRYVLVKYAALGE